MKELKQRLACNALKTAMPQHRVQNTNRNKEKGRDAVEGMGVVKWYYCQTLHIVKSQAEQLKP